MSLKSFQIFLVVVALVAGSFQPVLADKKYSIDNVHIQATVLDDGGLLVHESRSYNFRGSFTFAYRILPKKKAKT